MNRPEPIRFSFALLAVSVAAFVGPTPGAGADGIDRAQVVARHAIELRGYTPRAPLQVGNGEFAFAFDLTGMQTFPGPASGDPPLATMAQWGWHSFPERQDYRYEQTLRPFDVHGRQVTYATDMRSEAAMAIRSNPHRFSLARISLELTDGSGNLAQAGDLRDAHQTLSLWSGEAVSEFQFSGSPVRVRTACHGKRDAVAFSVRSPLVASGKARVRISFEYPSGEWGPGLVQPSSGDRHHTSITNTSGGALVSRRLDGDHYAVSLVFDGQASVGEGQHSLVVSGQGADTLEVVAEFGRQPPGASYPRLSYQAVADSSAAHWRKFWRSGGAIDLSQSQDPRWRELERRIVLSQYLTAMQCSGSLPPQETGLLCNSWHGKSHLEMHWWHAAHFPLWGRQPLLERSLGWYREILPAAQAIAQRQGYDGARWPKMTGPNGVSSPSEVGELLIWQQPHPIYFAELAYRASPTPETLDAHAEMVEQTAAFMASYAHHDGRRWVLGPVLIPAQECYDGRSPPGVLNPTFELAYWRWGLRAANDWRRRMGMAPHEEWERIAAGMAPAPHRGGVYTAIENAPFTRRRDHPSMLAAYGVLPDVGLIDPPVMRATLQDVRRDWDWPTTWGWDYPMMAMTAARLGQGDLAVDCLLQDSPKNVYLSNGHCWQADRLPAYLPANGGLLAAVAMMAAGWDDGPNGPAPGFPADRSWSVRHEGLSPMP